MLNRHSTITALIVIIVVLLGIGGLNLWLHRHNAAPSHPATNSTETTGGAKTRLHLYFIALGDNGASGTKLGCGDSLIESDTDAIGTTNKLQETFQRLLASHDQTYGDTGLYNALYESQLSYVSGSVSGDTVTVKLTGTIKQAGECDTPRIQAQLTQAAEAATGAKHAVIDVNGKPLSKVLSNK